MQKQLKVLNRRQIEKTLPHTGPMLLPTCFKSFEEDGSLVGKGMLFIVKETPLQKIVSTIFGGIFPNLLGISFFMNHHFNCLPGVIIIEFAAQTAALLAKTNRTINGHPAILRFENPEPKFGKIMTVYGDVLTANVKLLKEKRGMFYFDAKVTNQNGVVVLTTGIIGAAAPDIN